MNEIELEEHIKDCTWLWQRAYDRFQAHGDPHARDEALLWLHEQNQAILSRSPAAQAARHEQFERRMRESHHQSNMQCLCQPCNATMAGNQDRLGATP